MTIKQIILSIALLWCYGRNGKVITQRYRQVLKQTIQSREYQDILRKYYRTDGDLGEVRKTVGRLLEFYGSSWERGQGVGQ